MSTKTNTSELDDAIIDLPSSLDVSPNEKDFVVVEEKLTSSTTSVLTDLEAQTKAAPAQLEPLDLEDPNLVTWEGPEDPANPMNFKFSKKIWILSTVSALTFIVLVPVFSYVQLKSTF
jgi:DHA1 family multidrug resistance protein-like MFS transporter